MRFPIAKNPLVGEAAGVVRKLYSAEPEDKDAFTSQFDRTYSRYARVYDWSVNHLPWWRTWLEKTLPHIRGPRVLEASFGTGYLLLQYADRFETHGIDFNAEMVSVATKNLERAGIAADLRRADITNLPYADGYFDCVVNTMAFSGYPDGAAALDEIRRVLKPGGRLVLLDINYPQDGGRLGSLLTRMWAAAGDIVRDMEELFERFELTWEDHEVGGFGSVHLYICQKTPN